MKKLILLVLIPFAVFSQSKEIKYVVVKGSAEVKVPVDYLQVIVSVHTYSASAKIAIDSNRTTVLKMLGILRKYMVADSDFQTNDNSSREDAYVKEPERRHSITYSAQFNLRNVKSYDSLFQELVGLGNIDISVRGNGSNSSAMYKALAYQKAVKAAQHEAEILLATAHQSLGKLIKLIQDSRDVFTQYDDIDQIVQRMPKYIQKSESQYSGQDVTVSAQASGSIFRRDFYTQAAEVTAIYEIK
jgi:uncharacterized protein YggE